MGAHGWQPPIGGSFRRQNVHNNNNNNNDSKSVDANNNNSKNGNTNGINNNNNIAAGNQQQQVGKNSNNKIQHHRYLPSLPFPLTFKAISTKCGSVTTLLDRPPHLFFRNKPDSSEDINSDNNDNNNNNIAKYNNSTATLPLPINSVIPTLATAGTTSFPTRHRTFTVWNATTTTTDVAYRSTILPHGFNDAAWPNDMVDLATLLRRPVNLYYCNDTTKAATSLTPGKGLFHKFRRQQPEQASSSVGLQIFPTRWDFALCATYFCNMFAVTLPVVLLPILAAESGQSPAAYCARVAAFSTLGGAMGKLINGFFCQALGAARASNLYLIALAVCAYLLSMIKGTSGLASAGYILAGMEFAASVQWTACSVLTSDRYERNDVDFAAGMARLSLASTSGMLLAKLGGSVLQLQVVH
jgi:hypothetical protein